jgi:hypothetical protein
VSFDQVCAVLVKEPYNLTIAEIGKLTPYQLRHIFFRGQEEERQEQPARPSYRDVFYEVWRRRGWKEAHIDAKWQEYLREQADGGQLRT